MGHDLTTLLQIGLHWHGIGGFANGSWALTRGKGHEYIGIGHILG